MVASGLVGRLTMRIFLGLVCSISLPRRRLTGWREDAAHLSIIIDEFSKAAIRPEDHVYAVLGTPFPQEYEWWLEEFRTSGQKFVTSDDLDARRGLLRRLFLSKRDEKYVYVSQVTQSNASAWFSNRGGAMEVIPFIFLISSNPIVDWVNELVAARKMYLDKDFLRRVGRVMLNHWEHGIEMIGMHVDVEPFETVARELSHRLQVPLETRERGN